MKISKKCQFLSHLYGSHKYYCNVWVQQIDRNFFDDLKIHDCVFWDMDVFFGQSDGKTWKGVKNHPSLWINKELWTFNILELHQESQSSKFDSMIKVMQINHGYNDFRHFVPLPVTRKRI